MVFYMAFNGAHIQKERLPLQEASLFCVVCCPKKYLPQLCLVLGIHSPFGTKESFNGIFIWLLMENQDSTKKQLQGTNMFNRQLTVINGEPISPLCLEGLGEVFSISISGIITKGLRCISGWGSVSVGVCICRDFPAGVR